MLRVLPYVAAHPALRGAPAAFPARLGGCDGTLRVAKPGGPGSSRKRLASRSRDPSKRPLPASDFISISVETAFLEPGGER